MVSIVGAEKDHAASNQHGRPGVSEIRSSCVSMRCPDMETLSALLALCEGNQQMTGGSPSQKASIMELRCFQNSRIAVGNVGELSVIWVANTSLRRHCDEDMVRILQHTYSTHFIPHSCGPECAVFRELNLLPILYLTICTSSAVGNTVFYSGIFLSDSITPQDDICFVMGCLLLMS